MKTSTTFSILFWLKLSKAKNGKAPLYARITVNGKRAEISLKRKIIIEFWSSAKNKVKGTNQEARIINEFLDQVSSELHKSKNELKSEGKIISALTIKARYLKEDEQNYSLNDITKYHNEDMVGKLKWGTQKNYFTTQGYITGFLLTKFKVNDMYLKQLDYNFILKFETYLRNYIPTDHQKPMGNNTVMKHIERFRKMITLAYKLEWIDRDPFINFQSKFEKVERGFLTEAELLDIEEKNYTIERLQLVKGLFVFACYTGLSYIDVVNLTANDINYGIDGELWLIMKREKTNNALRIPILPKALDLINKYKETPKSIANGTIFPKMSNQKLNSYLKEIADLCKIRKNLTFHLARHTFATTVTLSNGVPIETVSKLLGHSRISTTQIYAKVIERKVSEDMGTLKSFLSKQQKRTKKEIS
ncbi:site-specific integrase [Bizionia arctica]|uniref:Transposase n=1 Tax=Bizionia arctica TaxID=1495645 RepID=A0A917GKB2_9FLAO|nr:site-specific integrase [Bizionia arctica]GGG49553.1 transposase [Bizionia arctica]